MSFHPMISHHLFAAAASNEPEVLAAPARGETPEGCVMPVPLELLDATQPLPVSGLRRLPSAAVTTQVHEATA
jgi:hypothetical protein